MGKVEKKLQNLVQNEGGNVDRSEIQEGLLLSGFLHFRYYRPQDSEDPQSPYYLR